MDIEVRLDRLEDALVRLAESQSRTEARFQEFAQAQTRTEARLEQLAQAQTRTEARLEQLAQAQTRTQAALTALSRQVGQLTDALGFTLEDLARDFTPETLARRHDVHVPQLERRFFRLDGEDVEVDLYGEGQRAGTPVTVIVEVRSRIYGRDVEATVRRAARLAPQLPAPPLTVLFGFMVHPSAREAAGRLGAILIASSGPA